jgi:hypothetical protein
MILVAAVVVEAAALDVRPLFFPYFSASAAVSLLCILGFIFIETAKLARVRADEPIARVWALLRARAVLMILPAIVFPAFLVSFTAAKTAIPFLVGYSWDAVWANADRLIFTDDVWHLTRRVLGTSHSGVWEWFYTVGWGAAFLVTGNAIALYARRSFVGLFFAAMFATWLIGGCLMAYSFSAAGPVFAHMFEPTLAEQFSPLREVLAASLGNGPIGFTQHYLAAAAQSHVAAKGGGISAMPSMHLGATSIYVLAARRTPWLVPAIFFWLIIFVASGYFGYHYWVDGIVAAGVAWASWAAAESFYKRRTLRTVALHPQNA